MMNAGQSCRVALDDCLLILHDVSIFEKQLEI